MSFIDVPAGKIAAVVTSLQMFARPPLREARDDLGLSLERLHRPDPDAYRTLFRAVGQDWIWFSRLAMSDAALTAILHDPGIEVYALRTAGADAGLLELDFHVAGECELGFFGVTAPFIGHGAARWLMNRAIERAWSQPITRFWVHTCTFDHQGAVAFYVRSGFRPFRQQIELADDPRLAGLMPRTAAPHVPLIEP